MSYLYSSEFIFVLQNNQLCILLFVIMRPVPTRTYTITLPTLTHHHKKNDR